MPKLNPPDEFDPEKHHQISVSQVKTFADCPRKWWFDKVARLPRLLKTNLVFGSAFHGVAERWLQGEELYPEGWAASQEGDKTLELDPTDQALIKTLIEAGIENGTLRRLADQEVEPESWAPLTADTWIMGFTDQRSHQHWQIDDHKTSSSTRWLLSPEKLATDLQLLTYCWFASRDWDDKPSDGRYHIRHNQFVKDAARPVVQATTSYVHQNDVDAAVDYLRSVAEKMREERGKTDWKDVTGPAKHSDACTKYGGCPRAMICGYQETPEEHRERIDWLNNGGERPTSFQTSTKYPGLKKKPPHKTMGALSKFSKKSATKKKEAAPKTPDPEPTEEPEAPEQPADAEAPEMPRADGESFPWAKPDCTACGGLGLNSRGRICRICSGWARKQGIVSGDYEYEAISGGYRFRLKSDEDEDAWQIVNVIGEVTAKEKEADPEDGSSAKPKVVTKKKTTAKKKAATKKQPVTLPESEAAPEPAEEPAPKLKSGTRNSTSGTGKPTLRMMVGCHVGGSPGKIVDFDNDIWPWLLDEFETRFGSSYQTYDPFRRKDIMSSMVPAIIERVGNSWLRVEDVPHEIRDLVRELRSQSKFYIVASGRAF